MGPRGLRESCQRQNCQARLTVRLDHRDCNMVFPFRRNGRLVRPPPKGCRSLLLCACASVFITACSGPTDSSHTVTIEHEISPAPTRVGPVVIIRLADPAARAIAGAHIAVEADMSHPGMSPVFSEAKEIEPGRYQARLRFEMAGDWVILLHVILPGGPQLERQIDVGGVRPN
jgi:YtkA-like